MSRRPTPQPSKKRAHLEPIGSKSFRARITDPQTGRRISITDSSEARVQARVEEARRIAYEVHVGAADPREVQRRFSRVAFGVPTVADVWKSYESTLRGQWRSKANQYWRVSIAPTLGKRKTFELSPEVMAEWERHERDRGLGKVSVQNVFIALRAAYRLALFDRLGEIPWRKWRPEKPPQGDDAREACRDVGELRALVRACLAHDVQAIRKGAFGDLAVRVIVLALCGLRQGEAVALSWADLNLDDDPPWIKIRHSAHAEWHKKNGAERPMDPPKGNRTRPQRLHVNACEVLKIQRARLERAGLYRADGPVFPAKGGKWRRGNIVVLNGVFRECVVAAGLPDPKRWVVHSLRHSFSTLETAGAFAVTGDVKAAMQRTGHRRVETLVGYLHASNRGLPASMIGSLGEAMPPMLEPGGRTFEENALTKEALARAELSAEGEADRSALAALPKELDAATTEPEREGTLAEYAREHPEGTPRHVMDLAEARYRSAYGKARRMGAGPEECQQRGRASKIAFLGAWGKLQKKARMKEK